MPKSFRPLRLVAAIVAAGLLTAQRTDAVEAHLPAKGVDDAIMFARMERREARQAFHDRYARTPGGVVTRISLVSEFRRVVLRTEEHIRLGNRGYSVRQMATELEPWRGVLEVIVDLAFHPQNTYAAVPLIDVLLVPLDGPGDRMPHIADATDRIPRFGGFFDPPPPDAPWWPFPPPSTTAIIRRETVTGGWVLAKFDAAPLAAGRFDVVVKEGATSLGSATFDFGSLR